MTQSRRMSLIESIAGTAIGFVLSVFVGQVTFPAFGHTVTLGENLGITAVFTVVSIVRGYVVRRAFNRMCMRPAAWEGP